MSKRITMVPVEQAVKLAQYRAIYLRGNEIVTRLEKQIKLIRDALDKERQSLVTIHEFASLPLDNIEVRFNDQEVRGDYGSDCVMVPVVWDDGKENTDAPA